MDVNLPINVEFSIHAASLAIQTLDRLELEEAFIELLHQKALDRQQQDSHCELQTNTLFENL